MLDGWVKYFERCSNTYGTILSRDIAFAATQSLFFEYSSVSYEKNGRTVIDISSVPKVASRADKFYISSREEIKSYTGCTLSVYERKEGFINYEVTPTEEVLAFE